MGLWDFEQTNLEQQRLNQRMWEEAKGGLDDRQFMKKFGSATSRSAKEIEASRMQEALRRLKLLKGPQAGMALARLLQIPMAGMAGYGLGSAIMDVGGQNMGIPQDIGILENQAQDIMNMRRRQAILQAQQGAYQ